MTAQLHPPRESAANVPGDAQAASRGANRGGLSRVGVCTVKLNGLPVVKTPNMMTVCAMAICSTALLDHRKRVTLAEAVPLFAPQRCLNKLQHINVVQVCDVHHNGAGDARHGMT